MASNRVAPPASAPDARPRRAPAPSAHASPWRRLKRRCLRAFQSGLELTGLSSAYVRLSSSAGATILMYHSVAKREHRPWIDPRFHVDPADFERQMKFLARRRRPVPLGRLVSALAEGRDLPARSVVVTFDDGYLDHLTVAAPILRRHGIPATFYLPTGYITRAENQWVDRLYAAFRHRTRQELQAPDRFDLRRPVQEGTAFRRLESVLLTSTYPERKIHLDDVEEQLQPGGEAPRLTMDWNDVKALRRLSPLFEIGGHTRDHVDLSSSGGDDARRDIAACAEDLDRELGPEPRDFSYPYERWTSDVKEEARRGGFRSACGAGAGCLITAKSDRFALPRLDPIALGSAFAYATSGAHPGLSRALTGRA